MNKKISLSDVILLTLEKSVNGYIRLEDFTNNSYIYARGYDRPLKKSALAQSLRRLRLKGYIQTVNNQGEILIKLLTSPRNKKIMGIILNDAKWDGKWRIVIFDIPETHRKSRVLLRSRLKLWQFEPWQKSVWATKKDVTVPLREFIKELRIEKWVRVFESDNV